MNTTDETSTPVSDGLRANGYWNPLWDPFAELDPQWTDDFLKVAMAPYKVLDAKTLEFIAIAVNASCTHMYAPGVRRHIRKALELGATRQEIAAVLQGVSILGIHSMNMAAPMLLEEAAKHDRQGQTAATF
ncbi:MAG TPA: carboxymuconolactone decarboxylase family protein [Burkholderiaceae bacterium]